MPSRHRNRAAVHMARTDRVPPWLRVQLIAEILVTYAQARRLMERSTLAETVATLRDGEPDVVDPDDAYRLAIRLSRPVVRTLGPLPVDTRCLMRSLVLVRMMARRASHCQVVIGAQSDGAFAAHAWVECAGRPVLPTYGYEQLAVV